jgi:hypothetical protein
MLTLYNINILTIYFIFTQNESVNTISRLNIIYIKKMILKLNKFITINKN